MIGQGPLTDLLRIPNKKQTLKACPMVRLRWPDPPFQSLDVLICGTLGVWRFGCVNFGFLCFSGVLGSRSLGTHYMLCDLWANKHPHEALLSCVSPEERQLLHWSAVEQMSAKEIAARLDCTPGAVRVRIYRACKTLREALQQRGRHELSTL